MTRLPLAAIALLSLAGAAHADSASSAGSSASSAGSASLGSISDSLRGSSDSSTGKTALADGDYHVAQVAEVPGREGMLRLTLRGEQQAGEFTLDLPRRALAARTLATGDVVSARARPYGYEFAHAATEGRTRQPFFLVLADDWQREIQPRIVKL